MKAKVYEAISQGASRSSQCQKYLLSLGGLQGAFAAHKRTLGHKFFS